MNEKEKDWCHQTASNIKYCYYFIVTRIFMEVSAINLLQLTVNCHIYYSTKLYSMFYGQLIGMPSQKPQSTDVLPTSRNCFCIKFCTRRRWTAQHSVRSSRCQLELTIRNGE